MSLTKADIVSLEVLLRAVIPYLLPSILLPYPLLILYKSSQHIDGQRLQLQILIIIKIALVYIFINLPYSITFLVQYSMMLSKVSKLDVSEIMPNPILIYPALVHKSTGHNAQTPCKHSNQSHQKNGLTA